MPRANRIFIPGHIWHITHRCHGREFLLEHGVDRQRWLFWLQKAQKRFHLPVLGYTVTCNHIHLLVQDPGSVKAIPRAMQLMQGCMAQEYNERVGRINAFWGDRYHATAVEPGAHLLRCLVYIDLNMPRTGVVTYPEDWKECSYLEIHSEHARNRIVNIWRLASLIGLPDVESFRRRHIQAIRESLDSEGLHRDGRWSESVAIGSQTFIENFAAALGRRSRGKNAVASPDLDAFTLREPPTTSYGDFSSAALPGDNSVKYTHEVDIEDI